MSIFYTVKMSCFFIVLLNPRHTNHISRFDIFYNTKIGNKFELPTYYQVFF